MLLGCVWDRLGDYSQEAGGERGERGERGESPRRAMAWLMWMGLG